ncbi:hypothetical protein D3C80_671590 [compost metagenome]
MVSRGSGLSNKAIDEIGMGLFRFVRMCSGNWVMLFELRSRSSSGSKLSHQLGQACRFMLVNASDCRLLASDAGTWSMLPARLPDRSSEVRFRSPAKMSIMAWSTSRPMLRNSR